MTDEEILNLPQQILSLNRDSVGLRNTIISIATQINSITETTPEILQELLSIINAALPPSADGLPLSYTNVQNLLFQTLMLQIMDMDIDTSPLILSFLSITSPALASHLENLEENPEPSIGQSAYDFFSNCNIL